MPWVAIIIHRDACPLWIAISITRRTENPTRIVSELDGLVKYNPWARFRRRNFLKNSVGTCAVKRLSPQIRQISPSHVNNGRWKLDRSAVRQAIIRAVAQLANSRTAAPRLADSLQRGIVPSEKVAPTNRPAVDRGCPHPERAACRAE